MLFMLQNRGVRVQTHAHDKCEFDGRIHEDMELPDADMTDYPTDLVAIEYWRRGMTRALDKCIELGVYHTDIPAAAWLRPWEHDPPNPDPADMPYDEYLCRKMGGGESDSGESDYDPEDESSSESTTDSDGDNSDADGDRSDGDSSDDDAPDHTMMLLDHAVASIRDDVVTADEGEVSQCKHMIRSPKGKWISKTTAVVMLRECCTTKVKVSADRLKRIEQCASVAASYTRSVEEHGGKLL